MLGPRGTQDEGEPQDGAAHTSGGGSSRGALCLPEAQRNLLGELYEHQGLVFVTQRGTDCFRFFPANPRIMRVGDAGFEPATSAV